MIENPETIPPWTLTSEYDQAGTTKHGEPQASSEWMIILKWLLWRLTIEYKSKTNFYFGKGVRLKVM